MASGEQVISNRTEDLNYALLGGEAQINPALIAEAKAEREEHYRRSIQQQARAEALRMAIAEGVGPDVLKRAKAYAAFLAGEETT